MAPRNRYRRSGDRPLSWAKALATFGLAVVIVVFYVIVFRLAMGRG